MGELRIRRLGYALGAEVTGVDASRPVDDVTVAALRAAWREHLVLCLPGQRLDPASMKAFCGRFGRLDDNARGNADRPVVPEVRVVSNKPVTANGTVVHGFLRPHWHSDLSYLECPTELTFLLADELPNVGGDTMFANQYAAYETLSPAMRGLVDPLEAIHDYTRGPGYAARSPEQQAKTKAINPPMVQPVVRVLPETGRKALYVANRISRFVGMTEEESRPLLDFLVAHATAYELTYRHRWTVRDLVMWDNRCLLHYAVPDYDQRQLRRMIRCSTIGPKLGRLSTSELEALSTVA